MFAIFSHCCVGGAWRWFQIPKVQEQGNVPEAVAWRQASRDAIRLQHLHTRLLTLCYAPDSEQGPCISAGE